MHRRIPSVLMILTLEADLLGCHNSLHKKLRPLTLENFLLGRVIFILSNPPSLPISSSPLNGCEYLLLIYLTTFSFLNSFSSSHALVVLKGTEYYTLFISSLLCTNQAEKDIIFYALWLILSFQI